MLSRTQFLVLIDAVGVVQFFTTVLRFLTFYDLVLAFQRFTC